MGYAADVDLYAYTGDDPVNKTDPSGNDGNHARQVGLGTTPDALDDLGSSPPLTLSSAAMAAGVSANNAGASPLHRPSGPSVKDPDAYWQSETADPIKPIGQHMGLTDMSSPLADFGKAHLINSIFMRDGVILPSVDEFGVNDPGSGAERIQAEYASAGREIEQIRLELAQASAAAVQANGGRELSTIQITQYHWAVFAAHGLPTTTFGGTMFTGTALDLIITKQIWCLLCK